MPERVGCEKIRMFRFAIPAQSVRDTEITIGWNFVHELLTIGTPFQHGAVSGVAKSGRTILPKLTSLPSSQITKALRKKRRCSVEGASAGDQNRR